MGALALLLHLPNVNAGTGPNIIAVRVWPADEYARVTIESDKPLSEKHLLVEGPDRLVIDIDGLQLSPGLRELLGKVKSDDPFIGGVRVGQNTPTVVRLVLDLKQPVAPQIFTLAPVAAYKHRLVFDLYPKVAPDPLLALIREKDAAERSAAQSVQDALGELIGKIDRPGLPSELPTSSKPVASASAQTPAPQPAPNTRCPNQDRPPDRDRARPRPRRRRPRCRRPHRLA